MNLRNSYSSSREPLVAAWIESINLAETDTFTELELIDGEAKAPEPFNTQKGFPVNGYGNSWNFKGILLLAIFLT